MRTVLLLLRKDLLRRWRSPLGVLVMLAFPLIFSGMLTLAFSDSDTGLPAAKLLLQDEDGAFVGGLMMSLLANEQMGQYLDVTAVGDEGVQMMEDGEASALLRIPPETTQKILDGETVTLELVRNPTQNILPEIAEQIIGTITDVLSVGARILRREADDLGIDLDDIDNLDDVNFAKLVIRLRRLAEVGSDFVDGPLLTLEVVELPTEEEIAAGKLADPGASDDPDDPDDDEDDNGNSLMIFLLVLPGVSVYALFIIGDQMMRDVLTEAQLGTLRRQLTAPIRVGQVIAGKVLASFVVAAMALMILASIVVFVAKVSVDLVGFVVLSLALLLSVSGLAAAIYGIATDEQRGSTLSSLLYLVMAFSGGSFLPLDSLPAAVQSVAHFSPFYWGTRGFQDLLDGGGLHDVLQGVLVLGILGTVTLIFGTWMLQRKVLRGNL